MEDNECCDVDSDPSCDTFGLLAWTHCETYPDKSQYSSSCLSLSSKWMDDLALFHGHSP